MWIPAAVPSNVDSEDLLVRLFFPLPMLRDFSLPYPVNLPREFDGSEGSPRMSTGDLSRSATGAIECLVSPIQRADDGKLDSVAEQTKIDATCIVSCKLLVRFEELSKSRRDPLVGNGAAYDVRTRGHMAGLDEVPPSRPLRRVELSLHEVTVLQVGRDNVAGVPDGPNSTCRALRIKSEHLGGAIFEPAV
ncbi:hypothetical protein MKZ38_000278 [Zalerion maritima]|uniref:Uncharacterized protein n=1 Tax=Zalerion maritima TaxID=339359 RepID=A0AAD5RFN6_9PEZI|nr:hypothetical protein MKZ38_000278 [Zalerion maritima]